mgnify:CR=1 FL=1
MQEITLGIGESIKLVVKGEYHTTTYELHQPSFAQDDGMSGNFVVKCVDNEGQPDTLSYVGMDNIHDDFGEELDGYYMEPVDENPRCMGLCAMPFVRIAPSTL